MPNSSRPANPVLGACVLIVDDNPAWVTLLREILGSFGVRNIVAARSAEQARAQIEKTEFDLIISDYVMPEEDGMTLARWVRAHQKISISSLPFILITAETSVLNVRRSSCCGADYLMPKPVSPRVLATAMNALLTRKTFARAAPPCGHRMTGVCQLAPQPVQSTEQIDAQVQALLANLGAAAPAEP